MHSRILIGWMLAAAISGVATAAPTPAEITNESCMECHSDEDLTKETDDGSEVSLFVDEKKLGKSEHRKLDCVECHDDVTEDHPDAGTLGRVDCAKCHDKAVLGYEASVHGKAVRTGSDSAPGCSDCHGSHEVVSPRSPVSPLHFTRQTETCGECHVEEAEHVAQSVHGRATAKGIHEAPSCTDCHEEHNIHSLAGDMAAREVEAACSRCHESERMNTKFGLPSDRVTTFFESYHGLAMKGGSAKAANCASCHGFHNILPSTDPESSIHKNNLVGTCGKCHPGASENFAAGPVHLNDTGTSGTGARVNHWVRVIYLILIVGTIGAMLLHNLLSWLRAVRLRYLSRGETIVRMNLQQRVQHLVLAISFIILALSGFALKFPDSWLAWLFGSDETIRRWVHRSAGIAMMAGAIWHLAYLVTSRNGRKLARDFMPGTRDLRELGANLSYFIGKRREAPHFARFGYAEKFEYWAVVWGTVLMSLTGLMIWFKIDFTAFFPRWLIDVAITIHYYEAILACLAILVWHLYHVIFAPDIYPMNFAWWDGKVPKAWHDAENQSTGESKSDDTDEVP